MATETLLTPPLPTFPPAALPEAGGDTHREDIPILYDFASVKGIMALNRAVLEPLRAWCVQQAARVAHCYVVLAPDEILLVILTHTDPYDDKLFTDLHEFTMLPACRPWPLEPRLLGAATADELTIYFLPGEALHLYGA
jgi:hypothetical protein